jgi:hypothetical protein
MIMFDNLQLVSACAIFKEHDKLHMNFPYMYCWKILKYQPKWIERRKHMSTPKPPTKKKRLPPRQALHQLLLQPQMVLVEMVSHHKVHKKVHQGKRKRSRY